MRRLPNIDVPSDRIAEFCRQHRIRKLAFFGSVLREDFDPSSDVDVLIEFEPGQTPGLGFIRIQDMLTDLLGRQVDLVTFKSLNRRIRDRVLASAAVLYEQG